MESLTSRKGKKSSISTRRKQICEIERCSIFYDGKSKGSNASNWMCSNSTVRTPRNAPLGLTTTRGLLSIAFSGRKWIVIMLHICAFATYASVCNVTQYTNRTAAVQVPTSSRSFLSRLLKSHCYSLVVIAPTYLFCWTLDGWQITRRTRNKTTESILNFLKDEVARLYALSASIINDNTIFFTVKPLKDYLKSKKTKETTCKNVQAYKPVSNGRAQRIIGTLKCLK